MEVFFSNKDFINVLIDQGQHDPLSMRVKTPNFLSKNWQNNLSNIDKITIYTN